MAFNSFYTRQAQGDALVTQITNPNRVGSGFINLGPQQRFASSTANWQTSALKGGSAPPPLIDILNAPRPSSIGLQPPPVAQKANALQASTPPGAPTFSPPCAEPNAQPLGKNMQPTSKGALRQARAARNEAKKVPPPLPTNRMAHPGGKIITSDKVAKVDKKVDKVAALAAQLAAQLAEDEALARQLQQQMLQHAPPEPVAALAEQRADAANRVAPASKAPAPAEATTGDTTSKRVRALRKKVRDIDLLEERQREGAILQQDQLDKIAGKAAIVKELGALACDAIEKEHGALTGDTTSKRVRALRKKVRDIALLEERQREGAILEGNQLDKIAGKAAIVKELGALLV